jgi:hypothetical protein
MKFSIVFGALAQVASAHYFFDQTLTGGASTKFIRKSTRATAYNPIKFSTNPAADIRDNSHIDGEDARCNQGAFKNAGSTDVMSVAAGSPVRVKLGVGATMQHPGPALVYMSRAPADNVKAYDGSGDWFKIFEEGVCKVGGDLTNTAWCTYDRDWVEATIPKDTPSGEYLLRFEHIGVHRSHVNQPEHYVSCVQVKVTGGGSGTPGPMVKFPGAYKATDEYANFSIYNGYKAFPMPGPAVWKSGGSGSSGSAPPASAPPASAPPASAPPASAPPASAPPAANCAGMYGQCGGQGFQGGKCCSAGSCKEVNPWYSQCV